MQYVGHCGHREVGELVVLVGGSITCIIGGMLRFHKTTQAVQLHEEEARVIVRVLHILN